MAQIVGYTTHAHGTFEAPGSVVNAIVAGDLLERPGVVGTQSRPTGWHPANPAEPGRFAQLTDGAGPAQSVYGVVNDFSPAPVNTFTYALAEPSDIQTIRITGGNYNSGFGGDDRIFLIARVEASTNGATYFGVGGANGTGYYQSDPSGSVNFPGMPGNLSGQQMNPFEETSITITSNVGSPMLTDVTHLRVSIFESGNSLGQIQDPFDGVNPYTGVDDLFPKAFVGAFIWEIDAIAPAAFNADVNHDGSVDIFDLNLVSGNWAATGSPGIAGDANADGTVDIFDVNVISDGWGGGEAGAATSAVPEPAAAWLAAVGALGAMAWARRGPAFECCGIRGLAEL